MDVATEPTTEAPDLIDQIVARLSEANPGNESLLDFARVYCRRVPADSIGPAPDAAAEVESIFDFIQQRPYEVMVRVFDPTTASHGYESTGTVIEIALPDSPFSLDSVINEIQARDLEVVKLVHPVVGIERTDGELVKVRSARQTTHRESIQHYVLDRFLTAAEKESLEQKVFDILHDVRATVDDFHAMAGRIDRMIDLARIAGAHHSEADVGEAIDFLNWLRDDNFVFLGFREYQIQDTPGGRAVSVVPGSGLGILRDDKGSRMARPVLLSDLPQELAARFEGGDLIVITKTNSLSTVHRRSRMDYVGVRLLDGDGRTVGEARMLGLYTSRAYMEPASKTPVLRRKLAQILVAEDLIEGSHDHKAVIQIFEGFSKHDLFAAPTEALRAELLGLLTLEERQQVKVFVRRDLLKRSISILVSMPRDRFNATLRKQIQGMITERFGGGPVDYHLALGEGESAQIHFTVWIEDDVVPEVDQDSLERDVIALARPWRDRLVDALESDMGTLEANRIANEWSERFPGYYASQTPLQVVTGDIVSLDKLMHSEDTFRVGVQSDSSEEDPLTRIALYRKGGRSALSDLMPALENLGLEVIEEVPTRLKGDQPAFIHDFGVRFCGEPLEIEESGERIRDTLASVWNGEISSDPLQRLVVTAGLDHSHVALLQAYRTYWKRVAPVFTVSYTNETLITYPEIAADLIELFRARFEPHSDLDEEMIRKRITVALDEVKKLDHDRILRSMLALIDATLRTNYYQKDREVLSFKFRSADVPDAPAPRPLAEIFVIGRNLEGIHLRGGPVARGGLRHSDRQEDYRSEVLGLMKAQITKNAVIVPTGAKGGFVINRLPQDRAERAEVIESQYRAYIAALLDVTDNRVGDDVVHPSDVVIHDGEDPYLVVAADKGTARFSDVANEIAVSRGFWLGDAFASGGSTGYDHKALGITARGAWESLKRHFMEMGVDPATDEFTAVGIGDMGGDVFGNGMLCSDRIRLIAAFNHMHVFIDPNPDAASSFEERKRLFHLAGSTWADYGSDLISTGGGVFDRSAKRVEISPEAQTALGTDQSTFTPDQLIAVILKAPVDLLWNGGIGTYVKASHESHADAEDRTNDSVRVNGSDLRTRVLVEGGNLGLTQHGRIEYAQAGGRINTDFIDNSGGVDASDREVNLKILLGRAEEAGDLDRPERNAVIGEVVDEVVEKILYDNYLQAQMLSQEELGARAQVEALEDLMVELEEEGIVDRRLDGLPDTEEMSERSAAGKRMTRPELSVLLVDAKRSVYDALVTSDLPDDPYFLNDLRDYFPSVVVERFGDHVEKFPLRRELAATILANKVVNDLGMTFVSQLGARTGATIPEIVRSERIAREVVDATRYWDRLEALFGKMDTTRWIELMDEADLLVASVTRWYLTQSPEVSLSESVADVKLFREIEDAIDGLGTERWRAGLVERVDALVDEGFDESVARRHVISPVLLHVPGAIAVAKRHDRPVTEVFDVFLHLGAAVGLARLNRMARKLEVTGRWARWARQSIEDALINLRYELADRVVARSEPGSSMHDAVHDFLESRGDVTNRVARVVHSLSSAPQDDVSPLLVAVRQLRNLLD